MEFDTDLVKKSREYVKSFFEENQGDEVIYHDLRHTLEVVEAAHEIGKASGLDDNQLENVLIAAWFHDTGYFTGEINHEIKSKELAESYLRSQEIDEKKIAEIGGCIIATKIPQRPTNLMEMVLCDADLYHLSTADFFSKSELLREEFSRTRDSKIDDRDWLKINIKFLKKHTFFTDYAREKLFPLKKRNLKKLKKIRQELKLEEDLDFTSENDKDDLKDFSKGISIPGGKDKKKPDRGIETLFRITSRNHIEFSSMADRKANIMISINSIMLSIVFSILFRRYQEYQYLIVPAIILSVVCTTTIIFAILATRPNLSRGVFTKEDIRKQRTNLLFFGNFYKMPLSEYEWGIRELMKDRDFLYGSIIRDIYSLGKVLGTKYSLLRISYTIFMYGIIISLIAFAIFAFIIPAQSI